MNNNNERFFHETWLGMVQPIEGLVVSLPALLDAQCFERHHASLQKRFLEHLQADETAQKRRKRDDDDQDPLTIRDLNAFLSDILDLTTELFDRAPDLPEDLSLWVTEGRQELRPTLALRKMGHNHSTNNTENSNVTDNVPDDSTPSSRAGANYEMLVWDVSPELALDAMETETGPWHATPLRKFEHLLRACRVPIGLLTNRRELRLVYAPHGESLGAITFRVEDMASVGGRDILSAFVMLLSAERFFAVAPDRQLPAILRNSRDKQGEVTTLLAGQVFDALGILLAGFESAAERDPNLRGLLDQALRDASSQRTEDSHVYKGLLTVLLRLVFLLYAEDRSLVPIENELYAEHLGLLSLFDQLQRDAGEYPDTMARRFGAWPRLLACFRAIYLGAVFPGKPSQPDLHMPARYGGLFDPATYPFLEGWFPAGGAPISMAEAREAVITPAIDDLTVYNVLEKLLVLDGQRLSYQELNVEQIGSVYENLMGYAVVRLPGESVRLRESGVWVSAVEILDLPKNRIKSWLAEEAGLGNKAATALAKTLTKAIKDTKNDPILTPKAVLEELDTVADKKAGRRAPNRLVMQPGEERRRTSSHYTPRSLTESIVRRTLEPLLVAMIPPHAEGPTSDALLSLKICDPAMGSGAFLVEACRFLADQLVAAWSREGKIEAIAATTDDPTNHARRLIAQRCLYGVDRNQSAVELAKLSMWLVTLARDEPFTFVDHALRHGDSLVGLHLDQLRGFDWEPTKQLAFCAKTIDETLDNAVHLRQRILELATQDGPDTTNHKKSLLEDAEHALTRARLLGDLIVGAFFKHTKPKDRKEELGRRLALVNNWLQYTPEDPPPPVLLDMQREILDQSPTFHWMLEFPEVFYADRPDPLDHDAINRAAHMDAFIGNPPFLGGRRIRSTIGDSFTEWVGQIHNASMNSDLCSHFFRRAADLLGKHGTIGLIATNTIGQGDTRTVGLQHLVQNNYVIYDAINNMKWPVPSAAVTISIVHLAKGRPTQNLNIRLDGQPAPAISSRLRPTPERPDPVQLKVNNDKTFQGSIPLGAGFMLTPEERDELITNHPQNDERIFPYIGGDEVNNSPTHSFHRYVISFGQMSLEQAEAWPDLINRIRELVKPIRDRNKRTTYRNYWWHFGEKQLALYKALAPLDRCLVTAYTSKYLLFSFQPIDMIFSNALYVFPLDQHSHFTILQSRIHEHWTRLLSSTMEDRLRYAATDCFQTFPFPPAETLQPDGALEDIGARLYEARAAYMLAHDQGMTDTYNDLKDPSRTTPELEHLRDLHIELDRAALAAYGWSDIDVPPFTTPQTPTEEAAFQTFSDTIIDRLFVLNAERAELEKLAGPSQNATKKSTKVPRKSAGQPNMF